ncbi:TVP38/TMEM64 family protein [Bacillus weihaiensis]|uniref:TVP38/TMEM64 family membrane protein n=1 Tax=Bacillus weihaiensis TaxID=1547283 RepID=A0A1L3MTU7_9BACI|nr:TVP38/TMEM64 family protein [Bacillus weihaiensis]APH05765.1 SNARE associated Golgi family protein [Bacillus weihaiensis]
MNKKTIGVMLSLIVVVGFIILINQRVLNFTPDMIQKWILSLGILAPIIYIILYTVRPFILFPASVLSLAGGLALGPLYGTLLTITGATLGAYLSFLVSRKIGGKWVEKKSGERMERIKRILEKNGLLAILLLRLIPLFPFDLISYAAGLSKIKGWHFILGTLIGIIPGTFAYNFLGASTTTNSMVTIVGAVIIFLLVMMIPALFKNKFKAFLDQQEKK